MYTQLHTYTRTTTGSKERNSTAALGTGDSYFLFNECLCTTFLLIKKIQNLSRALIAFRLPMDVGIE